MGYIICEQSINGEDDKPSIAFETICEVVLPSDHTQVKSNSSLAFLVRVMNHLYDKTGGPGAKSEASRSERPSMLVPSMAATRDSEQERQGCPGNEGREAGGSGGVGETRRFLGRRASGWQIRGELRRGPLVELRSGPHQRRCLPWVADLLDGRSAGSLARCCCAAGGASPWAVTHGIDDRGMLAHVFFPNTGNKYWT